MGQFGTESLFSHETRLAIGLDWFKPYQAAIPGRDLLRTKMYHYPGCRATPATDQLVGELGLRPETRLFSAARPESVCKLFNANTGVCGVLLFGGFLAAPPATLLWLSFMACKTISSSSRHEESLEGYR